MEREQVTLRLPPELLDQLREQAQEMGASLNETIIRYLRLGLWIESDHERLPCDF